MSLSQIIPIETVPVVPLLPHHSWRTSGAPHDVDADHVDDVDHVGNQYGHGHDHGRDLGHDRYHNGGDV